MSTLQIVKTGGTGVIVFGVYNGYKAACKFAQNVLEQIKGGLNELQQFITGQTVLLDTGLMTPVYNPKFISVYFIHDRYNALSNVMNPLINGLLVAENATQSDELYIHSSLKGITPGQISIFSRGSFPSTNTLTLSRGLKKGTTAATYQEWIDIILEAYNSKAPLITEKWNEKNQVYLYTWSPILPISPNNIGPTIPSNVACINSIYSRIVNQSPIAISSFVLAAILKKLAGSTLRLKLDTAQDTLTVTRDLLNSNEIILEEGCDFQQPGGTNQGTGTNQQPGGIQQPGGTPAGQSSCSSSSSSSTSGYCPPSSTGYFSCYPPSSYPPSFSYSPPDFTYSHPPSVISNPCSNNCSTITNPYPNEIPSSLPCPPPCSTSSHNPGNTCFEKCTTVDDATTRLQCYENCCTVNPKVTCFDKCNTVTNPNEKAKCYEQCCEPSPTQPEGFCLEECNRFEEWMRLNGCSGTVECRKRSYPY